MSSPALPHAQLSRGGVVDLGALVRAEDGGIARWPTRVRLGWQADRLEVQFDCLDDDSWGTLARRDSQLWTEEVVELFLAPGGATPRRYFELELAPTGVVFDARIDSPHGDRRGMACDPGWDCPDLVTRVERLGRGADWTAMLSIPWRALCGEGPLPRRWRLNLYRIERPRLPGVLPEHSAWSPTFVSPADFHRPSRFGHLELLY